MELRDLVTLVERVRATSRKTEKVALLADALRGTQARTSEVLAAYLSGTLPQGRVGLGWKTLEQALEQAPPAVPGTLSLSEVDRAFDQLVAAKGAGSMQHRQAVLQALFARASQPERRFLVQLVLGELRQGALTGLVLEALAQAARVPAEAVRQAAMYAGDLGSLARAAIEQGNAGLARFSLRLFTPVAPMLASPAEDVSAALERLGEAAFEYKLDGARIQVHKAGHEVRIFTRHLQDVTARLPEVVAWARGLAAPELVLEGEALVLGPDGRPQPFQVSMRRLGRSRDVQAARARWPLTAFFFDLLLCPGEGPLVERPYVERARLLAAMVEPERLLPRLVTARADEAERFLQQALAAGHEGLMAKALQARYVAGQRGFHWLKLKAAHTLDLVVLAAEWGGGRRQGWLSNLHLGARDPASGAFVMLGKTFKGLTDETLRWQSERLLALETGRDRFTVHVRPELVVEVAFGDVQASPRYPAGLALRFARVKRYRPDKLAAEADTVESVRAIFERQGG